MHIAVITKLFFLKKRLVFITLIFLNILSFGQNLNNYIKKEIIILDDSIYVDTLSIVPGTFTFLYNNTIIPKTDYSLFPAKSLIIFSRKAFQTYKNKICKVSYRVFPYYFYVPFYHKQSISTDNSIQRHYFKKYYDNNSSTFVNFSGLKKSGSISRGITVGNNQNTGLNSDFNLQISGKISPEIEIQANITDNNIPIQADGGSQNLREFDNVYIRLISEKSILAVGDLIIKPTNGYFMKFNKKVKGANFETFFNTKKNYRIHTQINAAVSKGKYNKISFAGKEGSQGPYRLTGSNGELYIIILSGSEKIYLDGILLKRGNENDYIINYNSGELTFSSKRIITKDSRVIAEFEYSEMNYARFTFGNFTSIKTKKATFFFNLFSEQDAKNHSLRQELSDEQKLMFHSIGDDIQNAFVNTAVLIDTFNRNEVLYRKTDTSVQSSVYQDIYVYSTDSLNAKYRVIFSFVGDKKGNYIRVQNGSNGKVFQWLAPVNGIPQGNYEPVRLLISPKKKQMISAGIFGKFKNSGNYYIESAISNNDINTFSEIDDNDNFAYSFKIAGNKNLLKKDTFNQYLKVNTGWQFTKKDFDAFERFKSSEFNRDWNLLPLKNKFDEHFASLSLIYFNKNTGKISLLSDLLIRNQFYTGYKNTVSFNINKSKFLININANRLTTKDTSKQTEFIRYSGKLEKKFKILHFGIKNSGEKNIFSNFSDKTAKSGSYRFNEFETYLQSSDSTKHLFSLSYVNREDFLPSKNTISYASTAHDIKFHAALLNLKNQTFKTTVNYRKLHVKDSLLINIPGEQTLSGRINYSLKLFHGAVSNSSFLEHTSGNEAVKEFSYFEVQNGQGIFAWKDFNGNKIKELNEFVKANFQDEANYIRIVLPSSEYKTVYNQSVYEVLNLMPRRIWHSEKGFKKFLSSFSNRFIFKLNRKTNNKADYFKIILPDSVIISNNKTLKNRFSFNLPKFQTQLNFSFISNGTKNILINGIDTKINIFHAFELNKRFNDFIFANALKSGNKKYNSEFFTDNNYSINYTVNESSLNYRIDKKSNIKGKFILKQKMNTEGEENLSSYSVGGEYRFSGVNQGSFQVNLDFTEIQYTGTSNTSISYEILEGLQSGKNFLWSVLWYKKITKYLQLELNYSGRKSENNKIIHTGGISLRAYF